VDGVDAADGVANAGRHRLAAPLGGAARPPRPAAQPVGGGQLSDQCVLLGGGAGRTGDVGGPVGVVDLLVEVGQPAPVGGAGAGVDDVAQAACGNRAREVDGGARPPGIGQQAGQVGQALGVSEPHLDAIEANEPHLGTAQLRRGAGR